MVKLFLLSILTCAIFLGCVPQYHANAVGQAVERRGISVGAAQRDLHNGMAGAEVAHVLGSPNIVSTDEAGREVWIYDKISTDSVYSQGGLSIGGVAVFGSGALAGGASGSSGASSRTQRTLTIIVKFDHAGRVWNVSYHSSTF
jgi:outer membrane protein assembly factor BamE (lipoprotein component of BamABCDE complex)